MGNKISRLSNNNKADNGNRLLSLYMTVAENKLRVFCLRSYFGRQTMKLHYISPTLYKFCCGVYLDRNNDDSVICVDFINKYFSHVPNKIQLEVMFGKHIKDRHYLHLWMFVDGDRYRTSRISYSLTKHRPSKRTKLYGVLPAIFLHMKSIWPLAYGVWQPVSLAIIDVT